MKMLMTRAAVLCGTLATSAVALAEDAPVQAPNLQTVATTLQGKFVDNINIAGGALIAVLTAGVVIVGAMYIWRILKRAFSSSK